MFGIERLKLLYGVAGFLWTGYWSANLLISHSTTHTPVSSGTVFCLALFISVPVFGYILLFRLFPLAGRFLRR